MGTHMYIGYTVISIILITVMFSIELFYSTNIISFIECYFEYLPHFTPIGFWYFLGLLKPCQGNTKNQ